MANLKSRNVEKSNFEEFEIDKDENGEVLPTKRNKEFSKKLFKEYKTLEKMPKKFEKFFLDVAKADLFDSRKNNVFFDTPKRAQKAIKRADLTNKLDNNQDNKTELINNSFCLNCGNKLNTEDNFCQFCGEKIIKNRAKKENKEIKEIKKLKNFDINIVQGLVMSLKVKLTSIEGFSSMIAEGCYGKIKPETKEAVIKINKSSKELTKIWIEIMEEFRNLRKVRKSGFRIMHFENDPFLGEIYRKKFEEAGFTAKHILHPEEKVLEDIEKFKPDLIMTNIYMPEMDGYQLIEKIKNSKQFQRIPIFVLSNLSRGSVIEKIIKLGGEDYWVMSEHSPSEIVSKAMGVLNIR